MRRTSYGQASALSPVDRLGVALSARRVRRSVGALAGRRVADFGCGFEARIACSLRDGVASLTLIDVALSAELQALDGVRTIEGALPGAARALGDASIDVVLCTSVIEHLDEPLAALTEIRRVLAPGGVAFVNVPSWFGKRLLEFSAFRLGLSPREEMDDHRTYYDPRDLWPLLVRAGFRPHAITCRRYKFAMNTFAVCRVDADGAAVAS